MQNVLITGASSGIGLELAKIFAKNNYNLILVARSRDELRKIADSLEMKFQIKVHVIVKDLCEEFSAEEVFNEIKKLSLKIDILINNAGIGNVGLFSSISIEKDMEMIQLNIIALTKLTKLFAEEMIKMKKGKILNVASTGSFTPGPYIAIYYATKAYVLSFSRAISEELKSYNITVSALCPGATKTNFAKRAGRKDSTLASDPSKIAKIAYKQLLRDKKVIVPGITNKILVKLPSNLVMRMVGKYQRGLTDNNKADL